MADKQFDVSAKEKSLVEAYAKRRLALREEYIKQITNPHRHGAGEGGMLVRNSHHTDAVHELPWFPQHIQVILIFICRLENYGCCYKSVSIDVSGDQPDLYTACVCVCVCSDQPNREFSLLALHNRDYHDQDQL
jgi:hypothetical protein